MKFALKKKEIQKNLLWAFLLAGGIAVYYKSLTGKLSPFDGLFLSGILFMCVGLWKIVRHMGLFNSTIYGYKKFGEVMFTKNYKKSESKLGEYHEFVENNPYTQPYLEALIIGIGFIVIGFLGTALLG